MNVAKAKLTPFVKSAVRAIDVLEYVAAALEAPSFAQIGSDLVIPSSSLFYLLNTLKQRGYLRQDGDRGGYELGPAVSMLAESARATTSWVKTIEPLVDQVWESVRETTSYAERRGDEIEIILSKLAPHRLLPVHRIGQRSPLYVFSGGKILLADLDEEAFEQYLKRVSLRRFTPSTLSTHAAVRREIAEVRGSGIAISREEHSLGIIGISVGLRTPNMLVGTLGVAIPAVRFNKAILTKLRSELQLAKRRFLTASAGDLARSPRNGK